MTTMLGILSPFQHFIFKLSRARTFAFFLDTWNITAAQKEGGKQFAFGMLRTGGLKIFLTKWHSFDIRTLTITFLAHLLQIGLPLLYLCPSSGKVHRSCLGAIMWPSSLGPWDVGDDYSLEGLWGVTPALTTNSLNHYIFHAGSLAGLK